MLATSIAETSITIDGVRIVIDSGLQRLPVFEPSTGITRLETVRAPALPPINGPDVQGEPNRASPFACGMPGRQRHFPPSRHRRSWQVIYQPRPGSRPLGVRDPADLRFLDQPPAPALKEARDLLRMMGALDGQDGITEMGRQMRSLSLPPPWRPWQLPVRPPATHRRPANWRF